MSFKGGNDIPLGRNVPFPTHYDKALLSRLRRPRDEKLARSKHLDAVQGFDRWTSYEMTWLDQDGTPQIAILQFNVPQHSRFIVESKSVKLYLGSLAFERFENCDVLVHRVKSDLEEQLECEVTIGFLPFTRDDVHDCLFMKEAQDVDGLLSADSRFEPDEMILGTQEDNSRVEETWRSDLLRTTCPVTGQPDYATVYIQYSGRIINGEALGKYIVGFRRHEAFHEPAVERIYIDLMEWCKPASLAVLACFARRGGIDIAPLRATEDHAWLSAFADHATGCS